MQIVSFFSLLTMPTRRFLLIASFLGLCYSEDCSYEYLIKTLDFDSEIKDVRPVLDWRYTTYVNMSMFLYTIVKLDNNLQTLTSYVWFSMEWKNEFISWKPEEFCGMEVVFYQSDSLWIPDNLIVEMTEADDKNPVTLFYKIFSDGMIRAAKPIRIVSVCNLDIFYYPFDTQKCTITIKPYGFQAIVFSSKYDSSDLYKQTVNNLFSIGEWNLKNFSVSELDNGAQYQITLKRNPSLQIIALIIPISFLVFLDLIGMFIHLQDMDRLMFKITVVLGFALLLVALNQVLATSDSPPLLSLFCCTCMAIMVASIIGSIATTYMMNLSETDTEVPRWIKFLVIKCLARVLFFKVQLHESNVSTVLVTEAGDNGTAQISMDMYGAGNHLSNDVKNTVEIRLLKMLLTEVEIIHQKLLQSEDEDHKHSVWCTVALVVDRLFLILYLIAIFTLCVVVITI